jgi:hypothetical protein
MHSLMQSWGTHLLAPPVGAGELSLDGDVVGFGTEEGGPGVMDGGAVGMVCGGADILLVVVAAGDDEGTREEVPDGLSGGDVEMAAEDDEDHREENRDVSEM